MTGGLTDRSEIPMGTWQVRFVKWLWDLGFMGKPVVETKAARDSAEFGKNPPGWRSRIRIESDGQRPW